MSHHLSGWFIANTLSRDSNSNPEPQLHALEERVLYSAAPFPVELLVDAPAFDAVIENAEQQLDVLTEAVESLQHESTESFPYQFDESASSSDISDRGNSIGAPTSFELVVIDRSVEDHEVLLNNILANRNPDLVTVRFINTNVDGVQEIARLLSETAETGISRDYDAVHIVSHGDAGAIRLGNVTLDQSSLSQHADNIASWSNGLTIDADILIYGCNLAASDEGVSLVDSISELSEADVAASDDVTGHADSQGDWELEYVAGVVDHDVVFSSSVLESWNHSLQTTLGDESGTSHNAIATNYDGDQTIVSSTDDGGSWNVQVSRYSHLDSTTPLTLFDGSDFENFQVNNDVAPGSGDHRHAVVGSAPNGDFVVAWVWSNNSGTVTEVFAKIFDAEGNVIKDQFSVASPSVNSRNVSVSMNELGDFAIAWEEHNGTDNDIMVSTYDRVGDLIHGPIQVGDESVNAEHSNVVVSYNDQSRAVLAYNGSDDDTIHVRVLGGGVLSNEYTFSDLNVVDVRDFAVDINDNSMVGVAFVADGGGSGNQDIYSLLLQFDSSTGNMFNRSPTTQIVGGFGGISVQAFNHSGLDSGLEFAPSIAVENNVSVGLNEETTFHVTWHGHGSWESNLNAGTVTDADGNPVSDESSFPTGTAIADNGVFISETTYVNDGSFTQLAERSLQNSLPDFDSASKNTSIVAFQDRSEIATVFETAAGVAVSSTSVVNQIPVAQSSSTTGLENQSRPFAIGDFGYDDPEGDSIQQIRIETLPAVGSLTLFGSAITQADLDATLNGIVVDVDDFGELRYQAPDEVYGLDVADFLFSVNDGVSWSIAPAQMTLSISAEDRLWLSTVGESAGIPGEGDEALQFGGPTLTYGEDTSGFWSTQFAPAGLSIDAVHFVNTTMELGTTTPLTVNRGDVLFSADSLQPTGPPDPMAGGAVLTALPSVGGVLIDVRQGDIIRFRSTSDDFSTGEYVVIANVEQMYGATLTDYDLNAFTLVAQDSILGDRFVKAGSILFSDSENSNDVMLLQLEDTGSASTGTISLLIEGAEVGISDGNAISGLELIEAKTTAGEQVLEAGSLLVSVEQAESVGTDESLLVDAQDIFVLKVGAATTSAPAEASAAIFFDGSDVGGDPLLPETAIDAVSLLGSPDPSELLLPGNESIELDENEVWRFQQSDFADDATPKLISVVITSLPDAAKGQLTFRGEDVVAEQVIPVEEIGFLVYEPNFNLSIPSDSFGYRAVGEGSVQVERSIDIEVAPKANDALIGGGTELHAVAGSDIEVATPDGWERSEPKIAALTDGGYVTLWHVESDVESSIYIQRFDDTHQKVGDPIDFTQGDLSAPRDMPRIVGLTDGGFVAIATRDLGDLNGPHTYVTQYDSSGQRVQIDPSVGTQHGTQLLIDGNGDQQAGDVAALQNGGFVVAFVDDEFGSQVKGTVVHDGVFVNDFNLTATLSGVDYADVSLASTRQGGFVATWIAKGASVEHVQARFFDVNGFPQGSAFNLATSFGAVFSAPSVSVLENNQTVVVWGEESGGDPAGDYRVVGFIFDADGNVVANDTIAYDDVELDPSVIALNDGGFLVAVSDTDIDGSQQSIAAHRFDSQFVRIGAAEVVNADSDGSQFAPDLAVLEGSGQVVAVWNTDSLGASADVVGNAFLFESSASVGERIALNLTGSVVSGVDDTITNIEISNLPADTSVFATNLSSGSEIELFGPVFDLVGFDPSTVEILLPNGVTEAQYQLSIVTNDNGQVAAESQTLLASTSNSFNDAPTTTSVVLTAIAEDSGVRVITQAELLANATDAEGDMLVANGLTISAGAGTLGDNGDGTWNYTPSNNDDSDVSFSYAITDATNIVAGSATLDITPVHEAPTGVTRTVAINQDAVVSFSPSSFGFEDAADSPRDSFAGVRILSFNGSGSLTLNGVDVSNDLVVDAVDLSGLSYQPANGDFGDGISSIDFRVIDDGASNNEDLTARRLSFNVVELSHAPTGESRDITINEDEIVTFDSSSFGFSDHGEVTADDFVGVRIMSFNGSGSLTLDGVDVLSGQLIDVSELSDLRYQPAANQNGINLSAIDFRVVDNGSNDTEDTATRTLTYSVAALNDAPTGTDRVIQINEEQLMTFSSSMFGFSDPADGDADSFAAVRIASFNGLGTLTINGSTVGSNDIIDVDDLHLLQFDPGVDSVGTATIGFQVIDDGATGGDNVNEDTVARTLTIDVESVNDRPTGEDLTITVNEESSYRLDANDFVLNDPSDLHLPNDLKAIRIAGSSGQGTLTFDGVPVADGTLINVADIDRLVFEAGSVSVDAIGTIRFFVIDDGGTANNGVDESEFENTITFDIRQVNQAPAIESTQFTNVENSTESHLVSVSDADFDPVTLSFAGTGNDNGLFEFTPDGKSIRFINAPDYENSTSVNGGNVYTVELVAMDAVEASAPHQILVTVSNAVEVPLLRNDVLEDVGDGFGGVSIFENDAFDGTIPADASIRVIQPAEGFVVIEADGTISFTPNAQFTGVAQTEFTYVFERGGETSQAVVELRTIGGLTNGSNTETSNTESTNTESNNSGQQQTDNETGSLGSNPVETDGPAPSQPTSGAEQIVGQRLSEILKSSATNDSGADTVDSGFADSEIFDDLGLLTTQTDYSTYLYSSFVDTGLLTGEFASRIVTSGRQGLQDLAEGAILNTLFWQELESTSHEYIQTELGEFESMITVGALGFSGVAITVVVRAALLGLSLGATYAQPWWMSSFDFLPIIDSEDRESIGQIVDRED